MKPIKKILLTGANGFTGRYFTFAAQKAGFEVAALQSKLNEVDSLEQEILTINPTSVVHLAGISFVASKDHEAFYRVHALGTSNLLQALTKLPTPPKKILLASSATVYGNSTNPHSTENQSLCPVDHYAMSKVAMEEMAKTFFDCLPIVIARPFNYTGHGQKSHFLIPKLVHHFANKTERIELGNLQIEREFNNVQMICDAYLGLLEFGHNSEIYNVCSGQARSLQSVINIFQKITGHDMQVVVNSDFVRLNEVHRMCGNPQKLNTLFKDNHLQLTISSLEDTLSSMLKQYENS